jgi:hypothetical protein
MPKALFRDNVRQRYLDQDDLAEVLERLQRLEQAVVLLAGGTNGNGGAEGDEETPGVGAESYSGKQRTGYTIKTDRDGQSQRLFNSADDMLMRGNLSSVDPSAHDFGKRYPEDIAGKRGTNDSAQAIRDRFLSRNPANPTVVSINSMHRRKYG